MSLHKFGERRHHLIRAVRLIINLNSFHRSQSGARRLTVINSDRIFGDNALVVNVLDLSFKNLNPLLEIEPVNLHFNLLMLLYLGISLFLFSEHFLIQSCQLVFDGSLHDLIRLQILFNFFKLFPLFDLSIKYLEFGQNYGLYILERLQKRLFCLILSRNRLV